MWINSPNMYPISIHESPSRIASRNRTHTGYPFWLRDLIVYTIKKPRQLKISVRITTTTNRIDQGITMAWRNTCETWWDGSKKGWCVRTRFCPKPQHSGNCYRCDPSRDQDLLDEIRKEMVEVTAGEDWVQSWFEFAKTRQGNFVNNGKSASKPYGDTFDTGESELDESEKALKETAKHLQNLIKENVQIRKKLK